MRHSAATGAPTRLVINLTTSTIRARSATRVSTRSPGRTGEEAFAVVPLIRTRPLRQAAVAAERVLWRRTAHSH